MDLAFRPCLQRIVALFCLSLSARSLPAANADWTTPIAPFRIADGLFYVGSRDLAAYLIATPEGDILLNANYITSPPQIRRSMEQLGFRWRDIKILLISHAHVDHAGGAAEIVRETGAKLEVMDGDVDVMETGGRTDFAFGGPGKPAQFPAVHVDRVLHDHDRVTLGGVTLTAHLTPGHTKGTTTWTMEAHEPDEPAGRLRDVVITGSWSVLSEYRLTEGPGPRRASYPGIAKDFQTSFAVLPTLPCDIFLAAHGSLFDMLPKLKRMPLQGDRVWIDPTGYRAAVQRGTQAFEAAYAREVTVAGRGARR